MACQDAWVLAFVDLVLVGDLVQVDGTGFEPATGEL